MIGRHYALISSLRSASGGRLPAADYANAHDLDRLQPANRRLPTADCRVYIVDWVAHIARRSNKNNATRVHTKDCGAPLWRPSISIRRSIALLALQVTRPNSLDTKLAPDFSKGAAEWAASAAVSACLVWPARLQPAARGINGAHSGRMCAATMQRPNANWHR